MGKINQIENRGAVIAWSPLPAEADLLAVGTKDSAVVGFDEDHGGELEVYHSGITRPCASPYALGSVKTTSRFSCLGWSAATSWTKFPMGLLAGGLVDGSVCLWSPAAIVNRTLSKDEALVTKLLRHHSSTAVSALQFNPLSEAPHLLATGGIDGRVQINSLEQPEQPTFASLHGNETTKGEVTQVAWNTQVSHILASSYGNGTVTIWDVRQKKPWCELRCEANMTPIADMAWNPTQGLHLITASTDDRYPALKLWDLRTSTTMPLETIVDGHTQGILSLAWCPHDESLFLSCGKDNQTLLWDMYSMKPIADVTLADSNDDDMALSDEIHRSTTKRLGATLSSILTQSVPSSSRNKKRYHVQWSPILRGCAATCSFDRKIEFHSILSHATKTGRPPLWMKPASGVSCGFGGSIITFSSTHKHISISTYVERPKLKAAAIQFQQQLNKQDWVGLCSSKAETLAKSGNMYESQVWGILQVLFQENVRANLIQYLGFDSEDIHAAAVNLTPRSELLESQVKNKLHLTDGTKSPDVQALIQQALILGNFEAAVECCLKCGNLGDALVMASCGGPDLWAKTQRRYLEMESSKRTFLSLVSAVIDNQMSRYVEKSDPTLWHETLAIICTYAPHNDFCTLCDCLGNLLRDHGDESNASLCYMCAYEFEKVIQYWEKLMVTRHSLLSNPIQKGASDDLVLHSFIEKVTVFLKVLSHYQSFPETITKIFDNYAQALADQGLFTLSAQYCHSDSREAKELKDRLYRSKDSCYCAPYFGSAPEFPYAYVNVGIAPISSKKNSHEQNISTTLTGNHNQRLSTPLTNITTYNSSYQQQQSEPPEVSPSNTVADLLPTGWISLVDPSSGLTYYANQITGVTTWERPIQSLAPVPSVLAATSNNPSRGQLNTSQYVSSREQTPVADNLSSYSSSIAPAAKLASKYGDGFVTSASHPELAEQYGNIGTSNPYADARPGTAIVRKVEKAPVSGTPLDLDQLDIINPEDKGMTDGLLAYISRLSSKAMTSSDQKLLTEAEKSVSIFVKRLAKQDITRDVVNKVKHLWYALDNRDLIAANAIQNDLVNSEWREHKDWLKGMKFLIQIVAKYN